MDMFGTVLRSMGIDPAEMKETAEQMRVRFITMCEQIEQMHTSQMRTEMYAADTNRVTHAIAIALQSNGMEVETGLHTAQVLSLELKSA